MPTGVCAAISTEDNTTVLMVIMALPEDEAPDGTFLVDAPDDGSVWAGMTYDKATNKFTDPNAAPPVNQGAQL